MSFFWKLVDETQMSKTPEATRHHNLIKLLILLPLRADLLGILQYETPCRHSNSVQCSFIPGCGTSISDLKRLTKYKLDKVYS